MVQRYGACGGVSSWRPCARSAALCCDVDASVLASGAAVPVVDNCDRWGYCMFAVCGRTRDYMDSAVCRGII